MILKHLSRTRVAGLWIGAILVLMAGSLAAGLQFTANAAELWLVAAVVPPAVMLLMWHPTPAVSVAELLHAADRPPTEGRR